MIVLGFIIAVCLFFHYKRRLQHYRRQHHLQEDLHTEPTGPVSCQAEWQREWADKFREKAERRMRQMERHAQRRLRRLDREARRFGFSIVGPPKAATEATLEEQDRSAEGEGADEVLQRA